jgi:CRISPR-associated protein Cas2
VYVIIVYDVEQKRVARVCKYLRRFLAWVQNSVFEGELTEAKFHEVKTGLNRIIKKEKDSVLFYMLSGKKSVKRECI